MSLTTYPDNEKITKKRGKELKCELNELGWNTSTKINHQQFVYRAKPIIKTLPNTHTLIQFIVQPKNKHARFSLACSHITQNERGTFAHFYSDFSCPLCIYSLCMRLFFFSGDLMQSYANDRFVAFAEAEKFRQQFIYQLLRDDQRDTKKNEIKWRKKTT